MTVSWHPLPLPQVSKSLDETKDILVKSIDEVLERGEKLEDLVDISKDLSAQSKRGGHRLTVWHDIQETRSPT